MTDDAGGTRVTPGPSWQADPWYTGQYRWWDGSSWTADVFPEGVVRQGAGGVTERVGLDRPPVPPPTQPAIPSPPPPTWVIQARETPSPLYGPAVVVEEPRPASWFTTRMKVAAALLVIFGIALGAVIGFVATDKSSKPLADTIVPAVPSPSGPTGAPSPGPQPSQQPTQQQPQQPQQPQQQPSGQPSPAAPATNGVLRSFSLRQSDLPTGQQLGLLDGGTDPVNQPTLDLCNGTFASEAKRAARYQVAAQADDGSTPISTEAVLYDDAAASTQAFAELQSVARKCPTTPVTSPVGEPTTITSFGASPDASWPAVAGVQRLAYHVTVTDSSGNKNASTIVYLRRGKALLGLYLPESPQGSLSASVQGKTAVADIAAIFERRLAAVPAASIGA